MITDRQGVIRWVNPAFSRLTGYRPEEILGNRPGMFNSGKHDELFYRQFWNTILAGQTWRGEFINRRRDGSLYIVEQTVTPMLQDGEVTHFISVSEDVTGRKQLEEQLRQAQKFQAIGQLAAGVAHEFNNLLTVIHCNSELLLTVEDRLTPAESKSLLQHMIAVSEHGANLTRRLGVFCREQVLQREPLNLNETIETLASMLRRSISENILWQFNCTPNLPFVCADAALIQQVITNLVWNAIDAMPRGGRLILSTERTTINAGDPRHHPGTGGGEFVSLSISDTGCGIAPENLTRLFEPFFSTKEVGKGTGLGLAMAYGIVKQHQGWIDVTSELDRGTVFKVFLPAIAEPAGPTADQTARG
jgi:PAS domain S-box-containing protein